MLSLSIGLLVCPHISPCEAWKGVNLHVMVKYLFSKTLTLPMLRLLSSKAQGCKDFWKSPKPCYVGIWWIALSEYSLMSTHVPGFQSFFRVLHNFVLAKLADSSIRVKCYFLIDYMKWSAMQAAYCFQGTVSACTTFFLDPLYHYHNWINQKNCSYILFGEF